MKKNAYKIIAIVLFAAWLLAWKLSATVSFDKIAAFPAKPSVTEGLSALPDKGKAGNGYSEIIKMLKSPFPISKYQKLINRNIFMPPERETIVFSPEILKITSIERVNLPFIYNGFIQTSNGALIAQISWEGKTYFVKNGGKIKDYMVTEIGKNAIKIEREGEELFLEFKKPAKGTELVATLYNSMDNKTYEVHKEDEINGYKILDIKSDAVILYGDNKECIINQEK